MIIERPQPSEFARPGREPGAVRTRVDRLRSPGEQTRRVPLPVRTPLVVAVVPAYNEAASIAATVRALREQWAPRLDEIIVVPNMPTWKALKDQRLRWQRGMLDSLRIYGLTRATAADPARQLAIYAGSLMAGNCSHARAGNRSHAGQRIRGRVGQKTAAGRGPARRGRA
jgi:hypothetical protein